MIKLVVHSFEDDSIDGSKNTSTGEHRWKKRKIDKCLSESSIEHWSDNRLLRAMITKLARTYADEEENCVDDDKIGMDIEISSKGKLSVPRAGNKCNDGWPTKVEVVNLLEL